MEETLESINHLILNSSTLNRLVELALSGIQREYPNYLERYTPEVKPSSVHPAFYGCYDWHSAVHSHWTLVRLLRSFPDLPEARDIRSALDRNLTAENVRNEIGNFGQPGEPMPENWFTLPGKPGNTAFERPYGWGWLLQLAAELSNWNDADGQRWYRNLQPLTQRITELFIQVLNEPEPPVREGLHRNTAFALGLALDYARLCSQPELEALIKKYALDFYAPDTNYSTQAEPGPTDFLSPALIEADLMRRVLPSEEFRSWFQRFLPEIEQGQASPLLQPVVVPDHDDPYICHLDGLNLSRAWCLYNIAAALPEKASSRTIFLQAAAEHAREGVNSIFTGNFSSTGHWLGTFVVYLLGGTHPVAS